MKKLFAVPILLMAYNRPDTTVKVFERIKKIKPAKLYVSIDGPKESNDKLFISKVKKIVRNVNWNCKVKTRFRKKNLGVRYGPIDSINWFFQNEEKGIILEDDCVPDLSFFKFCEILLNYYNHDKRILFINGSNFQDGKKRNKYSYYFSKYSSCWGWASWRRAWNCYDSKLSFWPNWRGTNHFKEKFPSKKEQKFWTNKLDTYYNNGPLYGAWDNQLVASIIYNNGLCITPNNNLITNIGYGENATHHKVKHLGNDKPTKKIKKVFHAKKFIEDKIADWYYFYYYFNGRSLHMPWFLFNLPRRTLGYFARIFKYKLQR